MLELCELTWLTWCTLPRVSASVGNGKLGSFDPDVLERRWCQLKIFFVGCCSAACVKHGVDVRKLFLGAAGEAVSMVATYNLRSRCCRLGSW